MSSAGSSQNDWSMAASYQSEDQSFSFGSATESEESSYFEVPSNHPNSYQSSVDSGLQPPGTTTCVGRDDIHCTHVHGREHCPLHSREGRGTEASSSGDRDDTSYRSSAQEQDMLELPIARENSEHQYLFASPAMERYLNDEQRHEKIALGLRKFRSDFTDHITWSLILPPRGDDPEMAKAIMVLGHVIFRDD
ncbi:hypothetical protein G7054_g4047 [Neopestalotiopsis clavispora]|nr:hypothetical protein G7054_g4047 [Neopestalotiopsis clavispora]